MNKLKHVLWTVLLSFTLITGCGQVEPEASGSEEKPKTELTPVQVLEKATKAAQKQTGLHMDTTMDQSISMEKDGMEESMDANIDAEIKMTRKPLAFYVKGTVNIEESGESVPMEAYFSDMTYYIKNPPGNEWVKIEFPGTINREKFEELLSQSSSEDPRAMLEKLATFQKELQLTHEKGMYVITLELDEKQSQKYMDILVKDKIDEILNMMKETGIPVDKEIEKEMDNFLKSIKIQYLKQTFHIDEKTFEQKKVDQELTMEVTIEGQKMKTDQKMSMEIRGNVDQITIPEEVKAQAVDLDSMEQLGTQP